MALIEEWDLNGTGQPFPPLFLFSSRRVKASAGKSDTKSRERERKLPCRWSSPFNRSNLETPAPPGEVDDDPTDNATCPHTRYEFPRKGNHGAYQCPNAPSPSYFPHLIGPGHRPLCQSTLNAADVFVRRFRPDPGDFRETNSFNIQCANIRGTYSCPGGIRERRYSKSNNVPVRGIFDTCPDPP